MHRSLPARMTLIDLHEYRNVVRYSEGEREGEIFNKNDPCRSASTKCVFIERMKYHMERILNEFVRGFRNFLN